MERIMRTFLAFALGLLLLAGCATSMPTKSERPEVTITAPVEKVRTALVTAAIENGYSRRPGDLTNLVFEKNAGLAASIILGSPNEPRVVKRVRFTLIEAGASVRVVAGFAIISARSRTEVEQRGRGYSDLQDMLNQLESQLESATIAEGERP